MNKKIAFFLAVVGATVAATLSSFAANPRTFLYSDSITVASATTPETVAEVSGQSGMGDDAVAVVHIAPMAIAAMETNEWTIATNAIKVAESASSSKVPHAALALLCEVDDDDNETYRWMGYVDGDWVELENSAVQAADGTYEMRVDLDYTTSNAPMIRYWVKEGDGTWYVLKKPSSSDDWLQCSRSGTDKMQGIDVYGYITTGAIAADAGSRDGTAGSSHAVAEHSMNYDKLYLSIANTNTWTADHITVIVRDQDGTEISSGLTDAALKGVNITEYLASCVAGRSYSYEVQYKSTYSDGSTAQPPSVTNTVDMFTTNMWYRFTGTGYNNATVTDLTIDTTKNNQLRAETNREFGYMTGSTDPVANVGYVVYMTFTDGLHQSLLSSLPEQTNDKKFGIAYVCEESKWYYLVTAESGNSTWTASTATDLPEPSSLSKEFVCRATYDTGDVCRVIYELKRASDPDSAYKTVGYANNIPAAQLAPDRVVVLAGQYVSALDVYVKVTSSVEVTPDANNNLVVNKNANFNLSNGTAGKEYTVQKADGYRLSWTDVSGTGARYAVLSSDGKTLTVRSGTPPNGLASYNSYVLGLNADTATDKPEAVLQPASTISETAAVNVYVPNISFSRDRGQSGVLLQRQKSTDNGSNWTNDGDPVSYEEGTVPPTVSIPLDGNLYRVNTIIK